MPTLERFKKIRLMRALSNVSPTFSSAKLVWCGISGGGDAGGAVDAPGGTVVLELGGDDTPATGVATPVVKSGSVMNEGSIVAAGRCRKLSTSFFVLPKAREAPHAVSHRLLS